MLLFFNVVRCNDAWHICQQRNIGGKEMTTHSKPLPYQRQFDATVNPITESHLNAFHYKESPVEHTIVFNRPGEEVNLSVQHFEDTHEVHLITFNMECGEPTTIHEEINLSYAEARMLKSLLNRPEVSEYLEVDFH